jgi:hypothetical protein
MDKGVTLPHFISVSASSALTLSFIYIYRYAYKYIYIKLLIPDLKINSTHHIYICLYPYIFMYVSIYVCQHMYVNIYIFMYLFILYTYIPQWPSCPEGPVRFAIVHDHYHDHSH